MKEIAEFWLDCHYPNTNTVNIYRNDFPDYVINYIKRTWIKYDNCNVYTKKNKYYKEVQTDYLRQRIYQMCKNDYYF